MWGTLHCYKNYGTILKVYVKGCDKAASSPGCPVSPFTGQECPLELPVGPALTKVILGEGDGGI